MQTIERTYSPTVAHRLMQEGLPPLLARLFAARGIGRTDWLKNPLAGLLPWQTLKNADAAARLLVEIIEKRIPTVIVADYDCDGAAACACMMRALTAWGADIHYVVPDRMVHGYGLTPSVVYLVKDRHPRTQFIITVDNGIASHEGIDTANDLGMHVIVTDHHLPSKDRGLPNAEVIVDPSQPEDSFASKALAGVGVAWYVLWATQTLLWARGRKKNDFKVSNLLPLVAVGTVADVVSLDENNLRLVQAGLTAFRQGKACAGLIALAQIGYKVKPLARLTTQDIGFGIGPRINAAGRMETMDIGIECLLTDDPQRAKDLAMALNTLNRNRQNVEFETVEACFQAASNQVEDHRMSIVTFDASWHAGVIGIVAGRLKEHFHRPTFVLTRDEETGQWKGSGRSIPGINLKDVLDALYKQHPEILVKFGGHAMAAGVSVAPNAIEAFREVFEEEIRQAIEHNELGTSILNPVVHHDGTLPMLCLEPKTIAQLEEIPWGQGFPAPVFYDEFEILSVESTGTNQRHLKLQVQREGITLTAMKFHHRGESLKVGDCLELPYQVMLDEGEIKLILG